MIFPFSLRKIYQKVESYVKQSINLAYGNVKTERSERKLEKIFSSFPGKSHLFSQIHHVLSPVRCDGSQCAVDVKMLNSLKFLMTFPAFFPLFSFESFPHYTYPLIICNERVIPYFGSCDSPWSGSTHHNPGFPQAYQLSKEFKEFVLTNSSPRNVIPHSSEKLSPLSSLSSPVKSNFWCDTKM